MRIIDADELKKCAIPCEIHNGSLTDLCVPLYQIDNAPTVEETEEPFVTECRNTAIEKNLPLYFVYYEETGVFEVYITETKELFEKRHCAKYLPAYKFQEIATHYLDWYLDWIGGVK